MKRNTILFILVIGALISGGLYYRYHGEETDERGATKLMQALEHEEQLTKETARLIKRSDDVNERDLAGQTALFYAARHAKDPQAVRNLIEAGADAYITDNEGRTALMNAAQYNESVAVAEELVKNTSHVNLQDKAGETALLLAAKNNTADVIKVLLRAKANPDIAGPDGKTPAQELAGNDKLTDEEKADYRQAMLVLSILQPQHLE